jgi:hypothetical protein
MGDYSLGVLGNQSVPNAQRHIMLEILNKLSLKIKKRLFYVHNLYTGEYCIHCKTKSLKHGLYDELTCPNRCSWKKSGFE